MTSVTNETRSPASRVLIVLGVALAATGLLLLKVVGVRTTYTFGPGGMSQSTDWGTAAAYGALVVGGLILAGVGGRLGRPAPRPLPSDSFSSSWSDRP